MRHLLGNAAQCDSTLLMPMNPLTFCQPREVVVATAMWQLKAFTMRLIRQVHRGDTNKSCPTRLFLHFNYGESRRALNWRRDPFRGGETEKIECTLP